MISFNMEFLRKKAEIQNKELETERYKNVFTYLNNNYWNRENKDLEEKLFHIIEIDNSDDFIIHRSDNFKKSVWKNQYESLKEFMNSLSKEQINSNLFLKDTYFFMETSVEYCSAIINELYNNINNRNMSDSLILEISIPDNIKEIILNSISTQIGIEYHDRDKDKLGYIDLLDYKHKHVYECYNEIVEAISKIVEGVYFLQINNMLYNDSNLICHRFQVYHPGYNNSFIVSFFLREKQYDSESKDDNFILANGLIQETIPQDKKLEYVLKRTNKKWSYK